MDHLQTTIVGILKAVGGLAYGVWKVYTTKTLSVEDITIIGLAFGGAWGNVVGADAKRVDQAQ